MKDFEPPALNVDIAEGCPNDDALILRCDWLNVCCAAHAGSWDLTRKTIERGLELGRVIGAHIGYPDRENFGRSPFAGAKSGALSSLREQMIGLIAITEPAYIKPHGAFYNESTRPGIPQDILIELLEDFQYPLLGLPGTDHRMIAVRCGVPFLSEGFADRRYENGHLVPRTRPDAMLYSKDEVQAQVRELAKVVDSICIHGDAEGCVKRADWVVEALK